jgi:hypothetical protein
VAEKRQNLPLSRYTCAPIRYYQYRTCVILVVSLVSVIESHAKTSQSFANSRNFRGLRCIRSLPIWYMQRFQSRTTWILCVRVLVRRHSFSSVEARLFIEETGLHPCRSCGLHGFNDINILVLTHEIIVSISLDRHECDIMCRKVICNHNIYTCSEGVQLYLQLT